jgi:hypothetical protein
VSSIRGACAASYEAALRSAERNGLLTMNHASDVGRLLIDFDGDAHRVLMRAKRYAMTSCAPTYWDGVVFILCQLIAEEERPRQAAAE